MAVNYAITAGDSSPQYTDTWSIFSNGCRPSMY